MRMRTLELGLAIAAAFCATMGIASEINATSDRCDVYEDIATGGGANGRFVLVERCVGTLGLPLGPERILSDDEAARFLARR